MNKNKYTSYKPDFEIEKLKIQEFFEHHIERSMKEDDIHGKKKYMKELVIYFFKILNLARNFEPQEKNF